MSGLQSNTSSTSLRCSTTLRPTREALLRQWGHIGGTSFFPGGAGPNGSKAKELYVRGRDVMDATFPVLFGDATMHCQRAEEDLFGHLIPDQRRTAQVLYDEVRVTPQQLARILGGGLTAEAAQLRLNKLMSLGVAERLGKGHYTPTNEYLRTDDAA